MTSAPPPPAVPLSFDLTQYADMVNNAFYNQAVGVIATSNGADVDLALKGSFMVWDEDHLAYWRFWRLDPRGSHSSGSAQRYARSDN